MCFECLACSRLSNQAAQVSWAPAVQRYRKPSWKELTVQGRRQGGRCPQSSHLYNTDRGMCMSPESCEKGQLPLRMEHPGRLPREGGSV